MIYIDIDIMINIDIHKLHYNTPNESYSFPWNFAVIVQIQSSLEPQQLVQQGMESLGIHYQPLLSTTRWENSSFHSANTEALS